MTTDEARDQLKRVFTAYPSYRMWLGKVTDGEGRPAGKDTGDAWVHMLTSCTLADATAVVDQIVDGRIPPPGLEAYGRPDTLPSEIKREAGKIEAARNRKREQFQKYHEPSRGTWSAAANDSTGHIAITLGQMVKAKQITREENASRMGELIEWDRGGPAPEWLPEVSQRQAKRNRLNVQQRAITAHENTLSDK